MPAFSPLSETTLQHTADHLKTILSMAVQYTPSHRAIVVADTQTTLAMTLNEAYRRCLPQATFINFDTTLAEEILAAFQSLQPSDLVILIQSTSFRLGPFRIRIELFQRELKVIEHPHLSRIRTSQLDYYIDSLAYDAKYYRETGKALKQRIDKAKSARILSGNSASLVFDSPLEPAKLNIGDYTGMKNTGGQFPIGEVFTEALHLEAVSGKVRIFAFADITFSVNKPDQPITLVIKKGRITDALDSTPEFEKVLEKIRADEKEVWVRELGFGMNRAFSEERRVDDVGTYERMCGIHLSLGAKHAVYKKPGFRPADTWHHVDVFVATESVWLDDQRVFSSGVWQI